MSFLDENSIDIAFIQESWLRKSDGHIISQVEEYNYKIISYRKPRRLDLGGGVAIIYKRHLKLQQTKIENFRSFENICCQVMTEKGPILISNVYRPGYSPKHRYTAKKFFSEFTNFMEKLDSYSLPTFLVGDYNFHLESIGLYSEERNESSYETNMKKEALEFLEVLSEFDYCQLVNKSTHEHGGTLDIISSNNSSLLNSWSVLEKDVVCNSDHFALFFDLNTKPQFSEEKITFNYRNFKNFDKSQFIQSFLSYDILSATDLLDTDKTVEEVHYLLSTLLNNQCPSVEKTVKQRSSLSRHWFTENLKTLKRSKRQHERKWKKCKCFYHKEQYDIALKVYRDALDTERSHYYTNDIDKNRLDPKALYKSIRNLLGDNESTTYPSSISNKKLADDMATFYFEKTKQIREEIQIQRQYTYHNTNEITPPSRLTDFELLTTENVTKLIKGMNNKSHPDNPVPVWFIKENAEVFAPIFRSIINKSFLEAKFPSSLKLGTIRPILKDKDSDIENFQNYRPVTNIPFLPKLLEKAANKQIQDYLKNNNLYPSKQSAYREAHSCETVMFNVTNNVQKSINEGKMVMLVLLDLSSAFDTIDQDILIFKLLHHFGISGKVLEWLKSYLKGRSFCVRIKNVNGKKCLLIYGVPQGTVLGPLLFVLYIHDITSVGEKYGVSIDLYADDSQWYFSFSPLNERSEAIGNMQNCIMDLKGWMEENWLKVNFDKTNVLFLGNPSYCSVFSGILNCVIQKKEFHYEMNSYVKSLGVYLDSSLSMKRMVNESVKSGYLQLKKLGGIKRHLDTDLRLTMVQSYILSRLDFCNSLYSNISVTLLNKLHSFLNSCIRFIYNLPRHERNIDNYYKISHILPVKYRIMFKLCLLAFKILNNISPDYLKDIICFKIPNFDSNYRLLRSTLDFYKVELPPQNNTLQYIMALHWNSLPINLRLHTNVEYFKKDLKTHYFTLAFP